jgi:hypothetical protein
MLGDGAVMVQAAEQHPVKDCVHVSQQLGVSSQTWRPNNQALLGMNPIHVCADHVRYEDFAHLHAYRGAAPPASESRAPHHAG